MDESIKPAFSKDSPRVERDGRESRSRSDGDLHEAASKNHRIVDDHSTTARADELAWNGYFSDKNRAIFLLFQTPEMYQRYIESSGKSLETVIESEREDKRLRQRWDRLRDAFHEAFESVLIHQDAKKYATFAPDVHISSLPFMAVWFEEALEHDIKIARVYLMTEIYFVRKQRAQRVIDVLALSDGELAEHLWHMHKVHWLRINRKQRSTKNDSLDILAEAA